MIYVELAIKDYMVFIKGKLPVGKELKEELLKMFENFGDVSIGEVQNNRLNKEYFTSARLSTEEKAN